MKKIFYILVFCLGYTACNNLDNNNKDTIKNGNVSTTISTDTSKLGQLLDIKTYKPTSVKFKYVFTDNSGQNERLTVPRPSDSYLEAILLFDTLTFKKLENAKAMNLPNFDKQDFNFDWLDKEVSNELLSYPDLNYHGHCTCISPNCDVTLFNVGQRGGAWFLKNKVLIKKSSN